MTQMDLRGAAVSIVKDGRLVYARCYTYADQNYGQVLPTDLFRIGSCSKLFTVLAIYRLIDQGLLKFTDHVWPLVSARLTKMLGSAPTLQFDPKPSNTAQPGHYFNAVTVENLLRHR